MAKQPTQQTSDGAPPWLLTMRMATGTTETPGAASNPKIMAARDFIADTYPEMAQYCQGYTDDSVPWCGLAVAYCCAANDIRPPFGPTDTDRFLWAQSFANDPGFVEIDEPLLGCIVVMTRSGGGHVTLYES